MLGRWIIYIVVGVLLIWGIEYLSRSFPPPFRMIALGVVVLVLILWLLGLLGFLALPV